MKIIGDVGNTETKIHLLNDNYTLKKKINLSTDKISVKYLISKIKIPRNDKNEIKKILFCSVVPSAFKIIKKFFIIKYKKKCFELKDLNIGRYIKLKVNKKQVGSDRIANAIGISNSRINAIVIDLGTATTFDVIQKKTYVGGIIAPGLKISLINLTEKASLIPKIKINKIRKVIGKNTISAVRSGFYWGYVGLIEKIIDLIISETKKNYIVILTGGLSHLFRGHIKYKVNINKDLTLLGLKKILKIKY